MAETAGWRAKKAEKRKNGGIVRKSGHEIPFGGHSINTG
jgi:hypothetical protein